MKRRIVFVPVVVLICVVLFACGAIKKGETPRDKLLAWRTGVWLSAGGTYTIWTPEHYFVLSLSGDTASPNIYYGCSQVSYHDKGLTRHQVQRFRKFPGGDPTVFSDDMLAADNTEIPYAPDTTLFDTMQCVIKDGVIYDAIIEMTDSSMLLISCYGDREMIFDNGTAVYLPAGGGEFYSYRIEEL